MLDPNKRTLLAAQGYCELGMFEDALAEVETLPLTAREQPAAVEMRLVILMQSRRWQEALNVSAELCSREPQRATGFIHAAYCLHELGDTLAARETLLNGPQSLHGEATYHYNLACYECHLGNFDLARAHLERSFALDRKFREFAKTDPDLAPLRR